MKQKLLLIALLFLLPSVATGKEVSITSLPNLGRITQAQAKQAASALAASSQKVLPMKYLDIREIVEVGFFPPDVLRFAIVEHGKSYAEEQEAIKNLGEMEREVEGLTAKLLSKTMTDYLCRDNSSYGKMMRTLISSGIVLKYHWFIGNTSVGTATITKNSKCTIR